MSTHNKPNPWKPSPNSLGDLIRRAMGDTCNAWKAYETLRTTYLKEGPPDKSEKPRLPYWSVFPESILSVVTKQRRHPDERERVRDFRFAISASAQLFVRNLWFAHRFFSKPREVLDFFGAKKAGERGEMFHRRLEQLRAMAGFYRSWTTAAQASASLIDSFDALKTDLSAALGGDPSVAREEIQTAASPVASSVADLIRQVEQRASYQADNPDDACEKALYFLALDRHDVAEIIAKEVLAKNPDHGLALYTQAVLNLAAMERHQGQQLLHDVLHHHAVPPVDAEEQWHSDRHAEEAHHVWSHRNQAFLLGLKAWSKWPTKTSIQLGELAPAMWRARLQRWLLLEAAQRMELGHPSLGLDPVIGIDDPLAILGNLADDIWNQDGQRLFRNPEAGLLHDFLLVSARLRPALAAKFLDGVTDALATPRREESPTPWHDILILLPLPPSPSLAEALASLLARPAFFGAALTTRKPKDTSASLLIEIARMDSATRRDRECFRETMARRDLVLNLMRVGSLEEAAHVCRSMAHRADWPPTELGRRLHACWHHATVRSSLEASIAAFAANDIDAAIRCSIEALRHAAANPESLSKMSALTFLESDEEGEYEVVGDLLFRQPNVITDPDSSGCLSLRLQPWGTLAKDDAQRANLRQFIQDHGADEPLLMVHARWLSTRIGDTNPGSRQLAEGLRQVREAASR